MYLKNIVINIIMTGDNSNSTVDTQRHRSVSISMYIEKTKKSNDILPLKSIIGLDERRIYNWVKDETVVNCMSCNGEFNFLNRKLIG